MLAYQFWTGIHNKIQFFAEEFVFARDRHIVYSASGVVVLNAAFVKNINSGSFGGGKNEG